jgi:D-apionolactonase
MASMFQKTDSRVPRNVLLYGRPVPPAQELMLRAGPLSAIYCDGRIRNIRFGQIEIVRSVYVGVRAAGWRTIPAEVELGSAQVRESSFCIKLAATHRAGDIDFSWPGTITGRSDGRITFSFEGLARSTFLKNRIGFCVLHPINECSGVACTIEKSNGIRENSTFPVHISPHQPFQDLRAISYKTRTGDRVEIRFEGDVFETEDQRNWGDASYKTYSTPLSLPYPVEMKLGTHVSQCVTIALHSRRSRKASKPPRAGVNFVIDDEAVPFPVPSLGLCANGSKPLPASALRRLKLLKLSHLRLDANPRDKNALPGLAQGSLSAEQLGASLEVALSLSDDAENELVRIAHAMRNVAAPVMTWLVFSDGHPVTIDRDIRLARKLLTDVCATAKFAGGTDDNFVELNRSALCVGELDLVTFSLNPQVHAEDEATLRENLEAHGMVARAARSISRGLPVCISPITLKPRERPDPANQPAQSAIDLPFSVDPRQMSLFGAAWTVGSLKQLGQSGVYSATYYETVGWRGVMESEQGSALPGLFPSIPGCVFPLFHVFADMGAFAYGLIVPSKSSSPSEVEGLVLRKNGLTRIILANLTPREQRVCVRSAALLGFTRIRTLDESTALYAMEAPEEFRSERKEMKLRKSKELELELSPLAIVTLDQL